MAQKRQKAPTKKRKQAVAPSTPQDAFVRTVLDSVQLGNIALDRVRASINPGMQGNEVLLGMSFLRELELMQRGTTLTLIQRAG